MGIQLSHIVKKYGNVTALNDVSLTIRDGEFVTLLGPSGCGKTTLLRIVAGFLMPDSGEVIIDGKTMTNVPPDARPTGMVFQSFALFPHMTVEQNVSFGLRMQHVPASEIRDKVAHLLEIVGVKDMGKRYPGQLSGGQQQRVAVARTLAIEPSVLLLDEPLASLDRKLRIQMRSELKKLVERVGITSIFVTHDQEEALAMSDRIAVMDHGYLAQYATPMEVYDDPRTPFVAGFIGNSNIFHGTVQKQAEGRLVLATETVCLPLPSSFQTHVGKEINVLLRPEHLNVTPRTEGADVDAYGMPGVISYVTPLGLSTGYEVQLESGRSLMVEMKRLRGIAPIPKDKQVVVTPVDPSSYTIIPEV